MSETKVLTAEDCHRLGFDEHTTMGEVDRALMTQGRHLSDLRHGEFGFSRRHNWTAYTRDPDDSPTQWACETCQRITARPDEEPDNCQPHDEPVLQTQANVGYGDMKRRR